MLHWAGTNCEVRFCAQVYTYATYGSGNIMTGTGAPRSFVASILNICQYQLTVRLSDTLQMFKVRFETPRGLQGSGVCAAKKQWNQWHGAKWREVRAPPYCDLVALNSSLFLCHLGHISRALDHMDLCDVTASRVADEDKATGCWKCIHRHVPHSAHG